MSRNHFEHCRLIFHSITGTIPGLRDTIRSTSLPRKCKSASWPLTRERRRPSVQSIRAISSSLSTLMSPSLRITAANERSAVGEYYVISKKHVDESSSYAADFSHFKKPLPNCVYACHDYPCEYGLLGHDGHRLSG